MMDCEVVKKIIDKGGTMWPDVKLLPIITHPKVFYSFYTTAICQCFF